MTELKNPMTVQNIMEIRKEFAKINVVNAGFQSRESLTEMILNEPDEIIIRLEKIVSSIKEITHRLECDDCRQAPGSQE
jgi:hypothetical protein